MKEFTSEFSVPVKELMKMLYENGYLHESFKEAKLEEMIHDSESLIANRLGGQDEFNLKDNIVFKFKVNEI